jgi:CubicO group peptidase (beta-lactamase class C family)
MFCLALLGVAMGCGDSEPDVPPRYRAFADRVEEARVEMDVPGVAVAVIEKGEVTFAHGFGVKVAGGTDPVTADTLFAIGSLTKSLTAMAALQAAAPEDAVAKYIPNFHLERSPGVTDQITLHHLLTHTSGIMDYDEQTPPSDEMNDAALEGFLTGRYAKIGYVESPPGAVWSYSNPNFMIAGLVAEKATGIPYRQLMRERIFHPLGMKRTFLLPSEAVADGDYAVGQNCAEDDPGCIYRGLPQTIPPEMQANYWSTPCGGAWSSVRDLARLARFIVHGQPDVLPEAKRMAMQSPLVSTKLVGDFESYGYGLFTEPGMVLAVQPDQPEFYNLTLVQHGGDVPGYATTFWCIPSRDICFVALANHSLSHFDQAFGRALPSLVDLPPAQPVPDIQPRPELFPAYAGVYQDATVGDVTITVSEGKVMISLPALEAQGIPYERVLQPVAIDSFVLTAGGEGQLMTFIREGDVYKYLRCRPYLGIRKS